jgi:hypothetical protein
VLGLLAGRFAAALAGTRGPDGRPGVTCTCTAQKNYSLGLNNPPKRLFTINPHML